MLYQHFIKHRIEFCDTIRDVKNLLPHFAQENVISDDDYQDINNTVELRDRVQKLMIYILDSLKADNTESFYIMLKIMETHGNKSTKKLAQKLRHNIGKLSN